jgi:nucleotide-binding universal stress UspA family protein
MEVVVYKRILVPLDGSALAEQAVPVAKTLAVQLKSHVMLFQAIRPIEDVLHVDGKALFVDEQADILRGQAMRYLSPISKMLAQAEVSVERRTLMAQPAQAICELAESARMDLIVMATHGRGGIQRWVYGSVADKVLHGSQTPLLLVRAHEHPLPFEPLKRIVVPLDGSPLAESALRHAQTLAQAFAAELWLFYVRDASRYAEWGFTEDLMGELLRGTGETMNEYLDRMARELRDAGLRARWEMNTGLSVVSLIIEAAQAHQADLIVMSTHGLSGIQRWALGSVADRVLRAATMPVLLIRSSAK